MNRPEREGFIDSEPVELQEAPRALEQPKQEPAPTPSATPPAADVDVEKWPLVVELKYRHLHETKTSPPIIELSFREPRAGDIMRAGGNPCRIEVTQVSGNQWIYNPIIDDGKMIKLMMQLSGIAQPILEQMDPRDYNSAAYRLRRFFLPEQGIW